jgi:hypothetical protein
MTRIAAAEEADGICDEADAGGVEEHAVSSNEGGAHMRDPSHSTQDNQMEKDSPPQSHVPKTEVLYVATPQEVHDYFDAVNILR